MSRQPPEVLALVPLLTLFIGVQCAAGCSSPSQRAASSAAGSPAGEAAAASAPAPVSLQTEPQTVPGRMLLAAEPLTLRELIERADRIVLGTVMSIENGVIDVSEGATSAQLPIRTVTIAVTRLLKGEGPASGGTLQVRQSRQDSAPLATQERILWYLPRPSRFGLVQPLGLYSGDFRVSADSWGEWVTNLSGNEGLWEGSVWTGPDSFSQARVLEFARKSQANEFTMSQFNTIGTTPRPPRNLPLDMLLSITGSTVVPPQ